MSDGGLLNSAAYFRAPTPMSTIVLLTPRETAKHLRCSERKLERHRLVGDGPPFVKIGAAIRYPLSELEKWLAERIQRSTSETGTLAGRQRRKAQRAAGPHQNNAP
jgi:predicted DNA-binding transcriptional regulator AlpA